MIVESFERIHRFQPRRHGRPAAQFIHDGWQRLGLTGEEIITVRGLDTVQPRQELTSSAGPTTSPTPMHPPSARYAKPPEAKRNVDPAMVVQGAAHFPGLDADELGGLIDAAERRKLRR